MKDLKPYHLAWLSAHPNRTEEWLRQMLAQGFQVHHMDGDGDNHCPTNLVLIAGPDHFGLHTKLKPVRGKNAGKRKRPPVAPVPAPEPMSAESFRQWQSEMDLSASEAALVLEIHPNTMTRYRQKGAPYHIALACAALFHRLGPWR